MFLCINATVNYPAIMQGISVCLFANSSFSLHAIDVKLANLPLRHPWSILVGWRFALSLTARIQTERRHFNDTFTDEFGS